MSFTIRYKKTGKEIELSNKAIYLHLYGHWLEQLGFKSEDLWENEE
jgi:hypothetical protein